MTRSRRAFTCVDALALAACGTILTAAAGVASTAADLAGQRDTDLANLAWIGSLGASYAADHQDEYWSYSWKPGEANSQFPDLAAEQLGTTNPSLAHSIQATDIIRRRSPLGAAAPRLSSLAPHDEVSFTHLILADYAQLDLPDPRLLPTGAGPFAAIARDFSLVESDIWGDNFNLTAPQRTREYFRSFYQTSIAFLQFPESGSSAIKPAGTLPIWSSPASSYSNASTKHLSATAFPAQKALLVSYFDFYSDPTAHPLFALPEARPPILALDGSTSVRRSVDMNRGWDPRVPNSARPIRAFYSAPHSGWPSALTPSTTGSTPRDLANYGGPLLTRGGLAGIDFDGPEINTGQIRP